MAANAEIICIGTELLLGDVLDTNSQFLAQELARLGIDCYYRTTVGDNLQRIQDAVVAALNRSDVVITSGGLGPTQDDLTIECLAQLFDVEMEFDAEVLERIEEFFRERRFVMPELNKKQAYRPVGSTILRNPVGTAPGIIWKLKEKELSKKGIDRPQRDRLILTFPGVPVELKEMWRVIAVPLLQKEYGDGVLWSCELKHIGIGESALAELYAHLINDSKNPTVAPYAGRAECRLRVTARAKSQEEARKIASPVIEEIRKTSGAKCYGLNDETLESAVGSLLKQHNMTIACAESCTGGLVSKRLTDVSGSSQYVKLNVVTYSNDAKMQMLNVSEKTLIEHGAVSPECAKEMAIGVQKLAQADVALSITGVAGPDGGTVEKPVGLVYLGLSAGNQYFEKTLNYSPKLTRNEIRFRTSHEALNMVRLFLLENAPLIVSTAG